MSRGYPRSPAHRAPQKRIPHTKDTIHRFTRSTQTSIAITDGIVYGAKAFTLSDLPDYSEFVNLFDAYRITKVELRLIPECNAASYPPGNSAAIIPNIYMAEDRNDDTAWSSINSALQMEDLVVTRMDKEMSFTIRPKCALAAYSTAFTSYTQLGPDVDIWVDTNSPNVKFYSWKWITDGSMETGTGSVHLGRFILIAKYFVECKQVA
jgi:hypothetical protein